MVQRIVVRGCVLDVHTEESLACARYVLESI